MVNLKKVFAGKKITIMGLGLFGRGVGDAKFLADCGADLLVTDIRSAAELKPSLDKLKHYRRRIKFVLGEHRLADFRDRDMIVKGAGVPLNSVFIAEARRNRIPIETDESLFARYTEGIMIGITGSQGKSTTTHLIYQMLKAARRRVHLGGNIKDVSTLALLPKVKAGDYVVLELASWQLQGLHEVRLSPHIAVFTNFAPDYLNYYQGNAELYFNDQSYIFTNQKPGDYLVTGQNVGKLIKQRYRKIASRVISVSNRGTAGLNLRLLGEHNKLNASLALCVAQILHITNSMATGVLEKFKPLPGRLELIRTIHGVEYYNDTAATTPLATIAALKTLSRRGKPRIILLAGGSDKMLAYDDLIRHFGSKVKALIFFEGTASERMKQLMPKRPRYTVAEVNTMSSAVHIACTLAHKGDIVLLSPAASSVGLFDNDFKRGDEFAESVKKIK